MVLVISIITETHEFASHVLAFGNYLYCALQKCDDGESL